MVADCCLICYQEDAPSTQLLGKRQEDFLSTSLISKELHAMFILRNIFEVPRESIQEYLETGTHPSEWITLCTNCKNFVEKAKRIYKEILDASKRFRKIRGDIIQCLRRNKRRLQGNGTKVAIKKKGGTKITDETRKFVSEHNYSESLVDPFVGGDCQAETLLYSSNVVSLVSEVNEDIVDQDSSELDTVNVKIEDVSPELSDNGADESLDSCSFNDEDDSETYQPQPPRTKRMTTTKTTKRSENSGVHEDNGCRENNGEVLWYCSCGRSYITKEKLRRHLREANMDPSDMFDCPLCDKRFRRRWDVKRHLRHHTGRDNGVKEGGVDLKVASVRGNVSVSEQPTTNEEVQNTSTEELSNSENLVHENKGLCKMKDGTEYWKCSCGKIYLAEDSLQEHVRIQSLSPCDTQIPTAITCPVCDLTFKRRFDRNRHMKKVHDMEAAKIQDNVSDNHQGNNQAEGDTRQSADNKEGPNVACIPDEDSGEESTYRGDGKHKELGLFETADGTEQWNCLCGKSYASQSALHRHVKEKNLNPKYWIPCNYCEKSFKRQSELKRHVGNVHEKNK